VARLTRFRSIWTMASLPQKEQYQGSRFRVQGVGCRIQGVGCRIQGVGGRIQGVGYSI
jgi:hypothetical protein